MWLIIPLLVIVSIWLPVIRHYYVPNAQISDFTIEQARREPSESVLQALRRDRLLHHGWTSKQQVMLAAERLLRGELHVRGYAPIEFRLPFHPRNLTRGLPNVRLQVAGLVAVDLLLQAYELTGQEKFFIAARKSIVEFARYESRAYLPRGLLWSDHAVANRVFVLSDFWDIYRRHGDYQPEEARKILHLLARSGEMLAKREHFIFATNHGIMQNVALLRLRLSFPALPNAERYQRLAMERLGEQMAFYLNEEGVILEHSAAYQFFGIDLLKLAFRYIRLLELQVPADWQRKYTKALQFAAQLRRPDGSLPLFGDTTWRSRRSDPLEEKDPQRGVAPTAVRGAGPFDPIAWYPVAGYAVWWDGLERWPDSRHLRQTVVTFSLFPGHAHKLADDLSVLLWAGGHTWWTNLGSWPYGLRQRAVAESWNGSNAPHLIGESKDSQRTPRMLSYGSSGRIVMLDVAREGPEAYLARRQIIHVKPNMWLVLDSVDGKPGLRSMTRWMTGHGIILSQQETENRYLLETKDGSARLFTLFFGSPGLSLRTLATSLGPYLGDSVTSGKDPTVPAIEVEQRADGSWAAAVWVFDQDRTLALPDGAQPEMALWRGPEYWTASVPSQSSSLELNRRGDRFVVRDKEGAVLDAIALAPPRVANQRDEIRRAFLNAASKYPGFRDYPRLRRWSTYGLIVVAFVQELFFMTFARRIEQSRRPLRLVTSALWIIAGIGLFVILS